MATSRHSGELVPLDPRARALVAELVGQPGALYRIAKAQAEALDERPGRLGGFPAQTLGAEANALSHWRATGELDEQPPRLTPAERQYLIAAHIAQRQGQRRIGFDKLRKDKKKIHDARVAALHDMTPERAARFLEWLPGRISDATLQRRKFDALAGEETLDAALDALGSRFESEKKLTAAQKRILADFRDARSEPFGYFVRGDQSKAARELESRALAQLGSGMAWPHERLIPVGSPPLPLPPGGEAAWSAHAKREQRGFPPEGAGPVLVELAPDPEPIPQESLFSFAPEPELPQVVELAPDPVARWDAGPVPGSWRSFQDWEAWTTRNGGSVPKGQVAKYQAMLGTPDRLELDFPEDEASRVPSRMVRALVEPMVAARQPRGKMLRRDYAELMHAETGLPVFTHTGGRLWPLPERKAKTKTIRLYQHRPGGGAGFTDDFWTGDQFRSRKPARAKAESMARAWGSPVDLFENRGGKTPIETVPAPDLANMDPLALAALASELRDDMDRLEAKIERARADQDDENAGEEWALMLGAKRKWAAEVIAAAEPELELDEPAVPEWQRVENEIEATLAAEAKERGRAHRELVLDVTGDPKLYLTPDETRAALEALSPGERERLYSRVNANDSRLADLRYLDSAKQADELELRAAIAGLAPLPRATLDDLITVWKEGRTGRMNVDTTTRRGSPLVRAGLAKKVGPGRKKGRAEYTLAGKRVAQAVADHDAELGRATAEALYRTEEEAGLQHFGPPVSQRFKEESEQRASRKRKMRAELERGARTEATLDPDRALVTFHPASMAQRNELLRQLDELTGPVKVYRLNGNVTVEIETSDIPSIEGHPALEKIALGKTWTARQGHETPASSLELTSSERDAGPFPYPHAREDWGKRSTPEFLASLPSKATQDHDVHRNYKRAHGPVVWPTATEAPVAELVLISCGKDKREGIHPARELYIGQGFKEQLKWYETRHRLDPELALGILSASYGLVVPDREIASYQLQMGDLDALARERWEQATAATLIGWTRPGSTIVVLAPAPYRKGWPAILEAAGRTVIAPLDGLDQLQRRSALSKGAKGELDAQELAELGVKMKADRKKKKTKTKNPVADDVAEFLAAKGLEMDESHRSPWRPDVPLWVEWKGKRRSATVYMASPFDVTTPEGRAMVWRSKAGKLRLGLISEVDRWHSQEKHDAHVAMLAESKARRDKAAKKKPAAKKKAPAKKKKAAKKKPPPRSPAKARGRARERFVDPVTGQAVPASTAGAVPTGEYVARARARKDAPLRTVFIEPDELGTPTYQIELPQTELEDRARARGQAIKDQGQVERELGKLKGKQALPGVRGTFRTAGQAAKEFLAANEFYYATATEGRVDIADQVREWADGQFVWVPRKGRSKEHSSREQGYNQRLAETAKGAKILATKGDQPLLLAVLTWVFSQTKSKRYNQVDWHRIEALNDRIDEALEFAGEGVEEFRGAQASAVYPASSGRYTDSELLTHPDLANNPRARAAISASANFETLKEATDELDKAYQAGRACLAPDTRKAVLRRLRYLRELLANPHRIESASICAHARKSQSAELIQALTEAGHDFEEYDPACSFPLLIEDTARLAEVCAEGYNADWPDQAVKEWEADPDRYEARLESTPPAVLRRVATQRSLFELEVPEAPPPPDPFDPLDPEGARGSQFARADPEALEMLDRVADIGRQDARPTPAPAGPTFAEAESELDAREFEIFGGSVDEEIPF